MAHQITQVLLYSCMRAMLYTLYTYTNFTNMHYSSQKHLTA
jgi:hypothetical protein